MGRFERKNKELIETQPSRSNRIIHIVDLGTTIGKDYVKLIIIYCLCYGFREYSVLNLVSKKWFNYLKDDGLWKSICYLKWGFIYKHHLQLPTIDDNEEISIRSWRLFYELWDGRRNWCHSFSRLISSNVAFGHSIICKEVQIEARTLFDNKLKPLYWCLTRSSNILTKYNIFMGYKDLKSYPKYPSYSREMLFIDTLQLKFPPFNFAFFRATCVSTKNKEHLSLYLFHVSLDPLMVEFKNGNEEDVAIKFVDNHYYPISFQENRDKLKLFALEIGWKEDRKDLESLYQMLRELIEQIWIYVKKSFYT